MAKDFSDSVRGKLRELHRPADEKLFIKYGIADEDGDLRKEGRFMLLEYIFENDEAARAYVLEGLKELEADSAKKSSSKE